MRDTPLLNETPIALEDAPAVLAAYKEHVSRVWNILIPRCAVRAEVKPYGVRYLHPTKGYKTVGKRRFAIRGVM